MLRYVTSTLTASVLAGTVSVLAQAPPPAQADRPQPQAQPQAQAQPQPAKETLTGCVMEAKTTDGGKAYVLSEAEGGTAKMYVLVASSSSPSAVGTTGTGAAGTTGTTGTSVDTNVNKKVQVTGPVYQPPAPANNAAADPKVLRPPTVQVESVKVVAETCK